ncbi:peptidase [Sphaerisporangium krabiense]|uniref:Membrane dipeptidase n=1 Tax=Sphaerisporangium krabiense TaxID=763782 RepID=A0A7W9DT79_9ACTN|nr:membrane dipeptidase [Sphaerisporangium krabiense]MBB5630338.1 membrane dipeptidase [Sphaerisporangium krabiense]GII62711.1 peptidase [Sphaerisporangium krabiense]
MFADLHRDAIVADTHNDLLMAVSARPPERWASFFRERWLPQLREGGVDVQVLPVFIDAHYRPEGALRQTLRMIECAHVIAEGNPGEVGICHDGAQIDETVALGRIALVIALESMPGVDASVELIPTLHRLGVRVASIAHWGRTPLADGSGQDGTGSRLTSDGVAALAEMERLGMVFDISHLGASGVAHVLEIATRPVIATHSSARALRDHHRNLTDDQLRAVAAGGGVVCVNFLAAFLAEKPEGYTIERLGDHIAHVAEVAGIDHVGLGPDFVREVMDDLTPPCESPSTTGLDVLASVPGLDGPSGMPLVTEELLRRGFGEDEVRKILGGNVMRLFRAELGRPAGSRPEDVL